MERGSRFVEWTHQSLDGTEFPATVLLSRADIGDESFLQATVRDISERKEAQEREELLRSLLRHDLRNKIQIVLGYLDLIEDYGLLEKEKRYLAKAEEGAEEGMEIIEKVSTLERAYEERIDPVDISSIVNRGLKRWRPRAEDEGMKIIDECSHEKCMVKGGPLLDRVFTNIVENSIRHSGGTRIRLSKEVHDEEVVCTIEDDGRGIPDEHRKKIFQREFTTDRERGSGLGMFLVSKLLEAYGGRVEVGDSELGGTRFDVYLKRA